MNPYNGPALAEWIESLPEAAYLDDRQRRHLRRWRSGHNPTEPSVDSFLCAIDRHLAEVPAYVVVGWPREAIAGLVIDYGVDGRRVLLRAAA